MHKEQDKQYLSGGEQEAGHKQMTTPAEARSSVTNQQQTAFDRERVVEPERQYPGAAKITPGAQVSSAGDGQPVVGSVDELPGVKPERRDQEAPDKQERRRAKNVAANRRYRERHGDAERQRNTEYKKAWRARRRQEQGLSPVVQQQPVFDRQAALERQLEEERQQRQQAEAKLAHKREKANERNRRYRASNPERTREQHKRHMRTYRARKREQGS